MKKTIILLVFIAIAFISNAQTNSVPPQIPDSTAADWQKAFSDIGIHISAGTVMIILAIGIPLVKALAGYARKIIPDSSQVNKAGLLLAHVAGEVNPSIQKLQAIATKQASLNQPPTV